MSTMRIGVGLLSNSLAKKPDFTLADRCFNRGVVPSYDQDN